MGSLHLFTCGSCGYEAEVSGGPDSGFFTMTQTTVCQRCKELVDAIVKIDERIDIENEAGCAENGSLRCPNCRTKGLKPWDEVNRPCPRCGSQMKKGDGPTTLWD